MAREIERSAQVVKAAQTLLERVNVVEYTDLSHLPKDWQIALSWLQVNGSVSLQKRINASLLIFLKGIESGRVLDDDEWKGLEGILHGFKNDELIESEDHSSVSLIHFGLHTLLEITDQWSESSSIRGSLQKRQD